MGEGIFWGGLRGPKFFLEAKGGVSFFSKEGGNFHSNFFGNNNISTLRVYANRLILLDYYDHIRGHNDHIWAYTYGHYALIR